MSYNRTSGYELFGSEIILLSELYKRDMNYWIRFNELGNTEDNIFIFYKNCKKSVLLFHNEFNINKGYSEDNLLYRLGFSTDDYAVYGKFSLIGAVNLIDNYLRRKQSFNVIKSSINKYIVK